MQIHHGATEGTEKNQREILLKFFSVPAVAPW